MVCTDKRIPTPEPRLDKNPAMRSDASFVNVDDTVFKDNGVKVIVDAKSLIYIDGTEVDFVKEGLNEGFEFNNPNAKAECGCGESFTV